MPLAFKRTALQRLAQAKLDDAILLLGAGRPSNAYYLAGYAAEIGLKACISRQISAEAIPDKGFINAAYQHKLKELVNTAGLTLALKDRQARQDNFGAYWGIVAQWGPNVRYETVDPYTAQIMIQALTDNDAGVFEWIKTHW